MTTRLRADLLGSLVLGTVAALLSGGLLLGSPNDSPLADAARQGDVETLRELIAEGYDVNEAHGDGMTPLHWAARGENLEAVKLLVEAGGDVHAGTRIGHYTPLHLASRAGNAVVIRALLDAGSDVQAVTSNTGVSAIHLAAESGSPDAIRVLVEHGADPNIREPGWGHTPLVFAAAFDRPRSIAALIELGADPGVTTNVVDVAQRSAVDSEAERVRVETLAKFREEHEGPGVWQPTPDQIRLAIQAGREVQLTEAIDSEEVDASPPRGREHGGWGGLTPLLHAARAGHTRAALVLLEAGADINQLSTGDRTSPLLIAAINGHFDLLIELVTRGADPNLASTDGTTPLYAVINLQWAPKTQYPQPRAHEFQNTTYLEAMEALLEAGADPNVRLERDLWYTWGRGRNAWGATPFWRAAYGTDVEAMRLLVAFGAEPHIPTKAPGSSRRADGENVEATTDPSGLPPVEEGGPGIYPVHAASGVGYGENHHEPNTHRHAPEGWLPAVRYLVEEHGADVNVRDHNGYNPVHHAAARGDNEMILYLVEQGADVTALSREGQTTADMANSPRMRMMPFPGTVALLERLGAHNNNNCTVC